jgi:hypothetical protein
MRRRPRAGKRTGGEQLWISPAGSHAHDTPLTVPCVPVAAQRAAALLRRSVGGRNRSSTRSSSISRSNPCRTKPRARPAPPGLSSVRAAVFVAAAPPCGPIGSRAPPLTARCAFFPARAQPAAHSPDRGPRDGAFRSCRRFPLSRAERPIHRSCLCCPSSVASDRLHLGPACSASPAAHPEKPADAAEVGDTDNPSDAGPHVSQVR